MSEEQRATIAKAKLPIKTRIAVWWFAAWALAAIPGMLIGLNQYNLGPLAGTAAYGWGIMFMILAFIVAEILVFLPVIFLGMKRTWSWPLAVALLCVYITIDIVWVLSHLMIVQLLSLIPGIILLVPLILIILDRKNYFKIAHQLELEKKAAK